MIGTAATLFRRQGYAATGLNQILDDAAVKPGSLYHHFPRGKQQLAAAVVDGTGAAIEQLLRRFLASELPVADIVDRWLDLLVAGLTADRRDGCPIEPIATESVHASALVRAASARAFTGWCRAIEERLCADGWSPAAPTATKPVAGRPSTSAGVSYCSRTPPLERTAMRSPSVAASSMS